MRQTRCAARSLRVRRSTSAMRSASSDSGDLGRRPSARWVPIERRRRPVSTRRGSRLCASAWRWRPDGAAEDAHQRGLTEPGHLRHGGDRALAELLRGHRSHAPQTLDRQRMQERQLTVDRDDQQTVRLRDAARHLGEELGPGHAHGDRQADLLEDLSAEADRDLRGRPRDLPQPTDLQERLVDRQPFDERRGVVEDLEHRLARRAVGLHARRDDDRLRAQPERLDVAHRRAHPERLGLVAGGQHHAAPHDHGAAPQARVVPLLDRRVEGVGVRVQDRAFVRHDRWSHYPPTSGRGHDRRTS